MKRMTQALAITLALLPAAQVLAEATAIDVRKTNGCGCCLSWMNHLEENGFAPTGENMFGGSLVRFKLDNGVPQRMVSCHTALIDGYVIEGHVPIAAIERVLAERPAVRGLSVPGMPQGSPGMEGPDPEPFTVYTVGPGSSAESFMEVDPR